METKAGLGRETIAPILEELKAGLQELYGPKLRRLILFGSYARGEAEPDSDIDVAVVLDDYESDFDEVVRSDEVAGPLSLEHDTVVSLLHLRERDLDDPWQPVHFRILQEGSEL
jgi:predicted nucleotidyltransferase